VGRWPARRAARADAPVRALGWHAGRGARTRALAGLLALALAASSGCAQIRSSSEVEIVPRANASARTFGPARGQIVGRALHVAWEQQLDDLTITVTERRSCRAIRHEPVVRIERETRRADGGLYWEFGLGAVLLAVGITGVARPETFASTGRDADGEVVVDEASGLRIAGFFLAAGGILAIAGIVDVIRARDRVTYAEAYAVTLGEPIECAVPQAPVPDRDIELVLGEWTLAARTDREGRARFLLPAEPELRALIAAPAPASPRESPPAPPPPPLKAPGDPRPLPPGGPAPEPEPPAEPPPPAPAPDPDAPRIVRGGLRLGRLQVVVVDLQLPFGATAWAPHRGEADLEPG